MTTMLLPLGQASNGFDVGTADECVIRHAGTEVLVTELAYLTWHACRINPPRAAAGQATRDTVCGIVAGALRFGVGPARDLDPRDGIAELHDAELLAELTVPRNEPAVLGEGAAWDFFETHRLAPGEMSRVNQVVGDRGAADIPDAVAAVVRASQHLHRLAAALVEAVEDDPITGQQAYTEVIAFMPLILGMGAAHLERVTPLYNSPRVHRFLSAAALSDSRRYRTG